MTVLLAGLKAPGLHSLDSFFVQSHAERIHYANVGRASIGGHHDHQGASSLILSFACFLGKLWRGRENGAGRRYSPAGTENTAPNTTARTGPHTRSCAWTDAG